MTKRSNQANIDAWTLDQLAKSAFFHRKLHEWKLLEVAAQLETVRGEDLVWTDLNIAEQAWQDLSINTDTVTLIFSAQSIVEDGDEREKFFSAMGI